MGWAARIAGCSKTKREKRNVRPTVGYLAGGKEPDCCVGVRPPSRLKKKKKNTK